MLFHRVTAPLLADTSFTSADFVQQQSSLQVGGDIYELQPKKVCQIDIVKVPTRLFAGLTAIDNTITWLILWNAQVVSVSDKHSNLKEPIKLSPPRLKLVMTKEGWMMGS